MHGIHTPRLLSFSATAVAAAAKHYKQEGLSSIVVAEDNYGEGSSREHAAMEPRFLGVRVILAKSFARIHETNLKKQGMLALTFADKDDYNKVREDDLLSVVGLTEFAPGRPLTVILRHADDTEDRLAATHTYNAAQIEWFKAGSALNSQKQTNKQPHQPTYPTSPRTPNPLKGALPSTCSQGCSPL